MLTWSFGLKNSWSPRSLGMDGWRVEVEPALAAPNEAARQLRLHDSAGTDRAVVVSFEDEGGAVVKDCKAEVRRQLEALKESEKP